MALSLVQNWPETKKKCSSIVFCLTFRKHFYIGSANLGNRGTTKTKEVGAYVRDCPTLGVKLINILLEPFSYKSALRSFSLITVWLWIFLLKEYQQKSCSPNVDEIDLKCQIHQHFIVTFSYKSAICEAFLYFIFVFVFFDKNYLKKFNLKILIKLTGGINFINILKTCLSI